MDSPGAGERLASEHPFCSWKRNQDGAICRKSIKKMLEVLVVKCSLSEHWALPGVSQGLHHPLPARSLPCPAWALSRVLNDKGGSSPFEAGFSILVPHFAAVRTVQVLLV